MFLNFNHGEQRIFIFVTRTATIYILEVYRNNYIGCVKANGLINYKRHRFHVEKYSEIKLQAANMYPADIDGYIEAKSPWINEIYKKIGL